MYIYRTMWLHSIMYPDGVNPNTCTCRKGEDYPASISDGLSMTLIEVLIEKTQLKLSSGRKHRSCNIKDFKSVF